MSNAAPGAGSNCGKEWHFGSFVVRAAVFAARLSAIVPACRHKQSRGVSDHLLRPPSAARPAASEVVAHATLSLPLPERAMCHRARVEGVRIHVVNSGRRATIVRLATRAVKALRAAVGSAPPTLRAADGLDRATREPVSGNYRRPQRKCLTSTSGGATF